MTLTFHPVPPDPCEPPATSLRRTCGVMLGPRGLLQTVDVKLADGHGFEAIVKIPPAQQQQLAPDGAPVGAFSPGGADERLELNFPQIPWDCRDGGFIQCFDYFERVYRKQHSEAFVWFHWEAEAARYLMVVPAFYYASGGGVHYDVPSHFCRACRVALIYGAVGCPHCKEAGDIQPLSILGTVHSHASGSAHHSSTDTRHESDATGFHLTLGLMDRNPFTAFSFMVAKGETRFTTDWRHHLQLQQDVAYCRRMNLWLTLVSSYGQLSAGSGWAVLDSKDRPIYAHDDRAMCELYVASGRHADSTRIIETKKLPPPPAEHRTYEPAVAFKRQERRAEKDGAHRSPVLQQPDRRPPDSTASFTVTDETRLRRLLAELPDGALMPVVRYLLDRLLGQSVSASTDLTGLSEQLDERLGMYDSDGDLVGRICRALRELGEVSWASEVEALLDQFVAAVRAESQEFRLDAYDSLISWLLEPLERLDWFDAGTLNDIHETLHTGLLEAWEEDDDYGQYC